MLLTIMSMSRCVFTITHYYFIYNFVKSRPPGRKMVTSDINVFATFFSNLGKGDNSTRPASVNVKLENTFSVHVILMDENS